MGEVKTGLAALVAAFKNSGAKIACLCSTDKVYEHEAIAAAMAIAAAGATQLYLAGRPEKMEAQLRAAGIKTFVYAGCDTVATLQAAHDILGMTAR
jgi:methylmalonyl-CoA mutase